MTSTFIKGSASEVKIFSFRNVVQLHLRCLLFFDYPMSGRYCMPAVSDPQDLLWRDFCEKRTIFQRNQRANLIL